jgi:hypothetical protein
MFSLVLNSMIKLAWFRVHREHYVNEARINLLEAYVLFVFSKIYSY